MNIVEYKNVRQRIKFGTIKRTDQTPKGRDSRRKKSRELLSSGTSLDGD
jgi:hypothetical protein